MDKSDLDRPIPFTLALDPDAPVPYRVRVATSPALRALVVPRGCQPCAPPVADSGARLRVA